MELEKEVKLDRMDIFEDKPFIVFSLYILYCVYTYITPTE